MFCKKKIFENKMVGVLVGGSTKGKEPQTYTIIFLTDKTINIDWNSGGGGRAAPMNVLISKRFVLLYFIFILCLPSPIRTVKMVRFSTSTSFPIRKKM